MFDSRLFALENFAGNRVPIIMFSKTLFGITLHCDDLARQLSQ